MISLKLFLLLSLVSLIRADFDKDNIQDDYSLRAGPTDICADRLRLEGDDLLIEASKVELNGEECTAGSVNLQDSPTGGNSVVAFFNKNKGTVGGFLAGPASQELKCGIASISKDTVFVLVRPDDDLDDVKWIDIFGGATPISDDAKDDDFDFDEDKKYLFLGDTCFYAQTNLGDRAECFPADATVTMQSGESKSMDQLRLGDRVLVADGTYSDVFAWTHHTSKSARSYVAVDTDAGHHLVATGGHYVYANGAAIKMNDLRKGMLMRSADGSDVRVVNLAKTRANGLYNPQTTHGDIVVNGLVATTYTSTIEPSLAHALLAPIRAAYKAVRAALPAAQSVEL